ncbi:MAG: hypothetical protein RLZZ387_11 [Chloroflexota bacterium]|jgi:integrase
MLSLEPSPLGDLQPTAERARAYALKGKAASTQRAYRTDWAHFTAWCAEHDRQPLPATPATIILYVCDLAEHVKVATIDRRLTSIGQAHKMAKLPLPTKDVDVELTMRGIRREKGVAPDVKAPAVTDIIRQMVEALPETVQGTRDSALLLIGFAGAFRRSELVSLDVADVQFTNDGVIARLRRSKTDQEGQGMTKGIPYGSIPHTCPVRALRRWLEMSSLTEGPLFRPIDRHGNIRPRRLTDHSVARIVKRAAGAAGLDPKQFSGHSLRAGLATAAAQAGVSERVIMQQTGHKNLAVLRRYIREGSLFRENAAAKVGL